MPTYKLIYFAGPGRAEVIRFIFKQAEVDFEDKRLTGEEWQKFKPDTPYGSLPVLEVDGKVLAGSGTIQRYLGEEFGLAGSNAWENAQLDSIIGVGHDLAMKMAEAYFEKDETRKAELGKKMQEEVLPKFLGIFEGIITKNNSPDGWVFGTKVTYVDLAVFNLIGWVKAGPGSDEALKKYPGILKHFAAVEALPNIAKWLKERPKQEY